MNHKQKILQINKIFLPLVTALCSVCMLLPTPAKAGPTTGQLQQQIDQLTAHVNRLRTLIEDPNDRSYTAGFAAVSQFTECLQTDEDIKCDVKVAILIDVLEGQPVWLEVVVVGSTSEALQLTIEKLPADNPLSSRDYDVNVEVTEGSDVHDFNVSPADPIYASKYDSNYPVAMQVLRCELVTDWRIKIIFDGEVTVKQVLTQSEGAIDQAYIEPYTESATETELKVSVSNIGDYTTKYIVTATGFGPSIEPVAAESVTLQPSEEPGNSATLIFPIRTVDTFAGQGPCRVTLKSTSGKIYATTTADFPAPLPDPPPPEYIPDFDGDGDVDFGDFGYFSLYWLEQTDS